MNLSEDQIIEKYGKKCGHCNPNTLLRYEYEWTCFSCGYNVKKTKTRTLLDTSKKKFINRLKYAEVKIFSRCVDV